MGFNLLKIFNVGELVDKGIKELTSKEDLVTKVSYLLGINTQINQSVESLTDLGKNLGAVFQKPFGASLSGVKASPKSYLFENDYPVISGGYGLTINGKELGAERLMFVTNMEIKHNVGTDTCDFTVSDPNFYFIEDNIYKRDSPIQASISLLGVPETNNYTKIYFDGYISIVDINFPNDGAPTLQISCIDKATHLMTRKKWRRSWEDVTSSQVVSEIAKEMGFKCYVESDYPFPLQASIIQDGKTNMEFLEELAGKELELFVINPVVNSDGSVILYYVIKGHINEQFYYSLGYKASSGKDEKDEMKWHNYDIINFTPRINIETRREEEKEEGINADNKDNESFTDYPEDPVNEGGGTSNNEETSNPGETSSSGNNDRVYIKI